MLTMIHYRGQVAGFATGRQLNLVEPWDTRPDSDPERRFIYTMALLVKEIEDGQVEGPYTDAAGEVYARAVLIDADELRVRAHEPDERLAGDYGVPLEQVVRRREDLDDQAISKHVEHGTEDIARETYGDARVDDWFRANGWDPDACR